jgi:hypothetical protein
MLLPEHIAVRRTSVKAGCKVAVSAFFLIQCNMDVFIYVEFIQGQFLFNFQIAFLAFIASDRICQTEVFSRMTSLRTE